MTNHPTKRRTSPFIVWPVCLLVFVLLYLASAGPFVWLWSHGVISNDTALRIHKTVYFPIYVLKGNTFFFTSNPIGRAYGRYLNWWAETWWVV